MCHEVLYHGSTIVLQCYRRQSISMKQWKIRPSVILYPLNWLLPNLAWMIMSGVPTHMPSFVILSAGEFPPNRWNITTLWRFRPFLFSSARIAAKPANRPSDQWLKTHRICWGCAFLGALTKNGYPLSLASNFGDFAFHKPFFTPNTHKSCRKCHQIL